MVAKLDLPGHYKTVIVEISPTNTEHGFDGAEAFISLLDELKEDLDGSPDHMGFFHNRSSLLKAYSEGRMYGLCSFWSEEMNEHQSFDDPVFVTNKHGMVHCMLPCFLVLKKEWDGAPSVCTFLWVAERARNKGMAKYMLDFFDVRSATLPLPEAKAFWAHHFAHVQDDIDKYNEIASTPSANE